MQATSYQELMAEQARAAVRISGAHHSSWNGQVRATGPDRKIRGGVTWRHTIEYNDEKVTAPLKEMYANARVRNQDVESLRSYREAVKTVFHENTHLLAAEGTDHRDAKDAYQDPSVRALEEGITEIHSYDNLNQYIDELGLEEVAPGISSALASPSYSEFTPAARRSAEAIGRESGTDPAEVVRRLAVVNAEQKFRVAAELLYDNSDLPGLVPGQEREAAVRRIETAMKPAFAGIDHLDGSDAQQLRRQSAKAGAAAGRAGRDEVRILGQQWTAPQPSQQVLQEPQRGPQQPEQTRKAEETSQPQQAAAGAQQSQQGLQLQQPNDLQQATRAGLSGTAPMTGVRQLNSDQQGSRRSSGTGHQRRGPDREL